MQKVASKFASALLAGALVLGCAGFAATAVEAATPQKAHAAEVGSWQEDGGWWWFAYQNGGYATGWVQIDGTWYLFDSAGWMLTGWQSVGGTWYYFYGSGAMATGWLDLGGTWYYLYDSGAMAEGWLYQGGTWYYLLPGGPMATGWVDLGGEWYYFDGSGVMQAGRWIGDYYVYDNGCMALNAWIGDYYVGSDGLWTGITKDNYTEDSIVGEWHVVGAHTEESGWTYGELPHSHSCLQVHDNGSFSMKLNGTYYTGTWEYDAEDSDAETDWYDLYDYDSGLHLWFAVVSLEDDIMILVLDDDTYETAIAFERA